MKMSARQFSKYGNDIYGFPRQTQLFEIELGLEV